MHRTKKINKMVQATNDTVEANGHFDQNNEKLSNVTTTQYSIDALKDDKIFQNQAHHLLNIFPEEIWLMILEQLSSDHNSLENVNNTSLLFRKILPPQRQQFLFPKVWEILALKYESGELDEYCYNENTEHPEAIRERYDSTPWRSRILKLRLVCRKWCEGIDQFYHNLDHYYKMKGDYAHTKQSQGPEFVEPGTWADIIEFNETRRPELEDFVNHFAATHSSCGKGIRNPFLTRKVTLTFTGLDYEFLEELTILILKYGRYIWYCIIYCDDNFFTRVEFYWKLKELLLLMPNLKILEINYSKERTSILDRNYGMVSVDEQPTRKELIQLKREIKSNPLRALKSLNFLKTSYLPAAIFNELIRSNSKNISMLEVSRDNNFHDAYDIYSVEMPSLKRLSFEFFSDSQFEKLEQCRMTWKLEKLYLDFRKSHFIQWSRIFYLLGHKWKDSLTHVGIYLPMTTGVSEENRVLKACTYYKLDLPKIKRFKFIFGHVTSLEMLPPANDLVELTDIKVDCIVKQLKKNRFAVKPEFVLVNEIQVDLASLPESSKWKKFPKSKSIDMSEIFDKNTDRVCNSYGNRRGNIYRATRRSELENIAEKSWLEEENY